MLQAEGLHVYYGGIHALKGVRLQVDEGRIVTLIGANGAGKTTTLRSIVDWSARWGRVFSREDLTHLPPTGSSGAGSR